MGTDQNSDYIFVEREVLLDYEGGILVGIHRANLFLLGNQYVGRRVRVTGEVQRDSANRRFITVTRRQQIELR